WTLENDTTWDINLRPDVTFSDGTKLTADDVAFTLKRVSAVPTTVANFSEYVKGIAGIEVTGPYQLRLTTHGENATTDDYNTGTAAIGTGPYRLISWARGDRLVMERNEHYWGARPAWDKVTFRYVKNG